MHQTALKNLVNRFLKEKETDVFENLFDSRKSIKNLADIDDKINLIVKNYEPKRKANMKDLKRIVNILNKSISITTKHQHDKIDSKLNKNSEDHSSIDEIIDQIETLRNTKKLPLEQSIGKRVKSRRQKQKRLKRKTWKVKTLKQ